MEAPACANAALIQAGIMGKAQNNIQKNLLSTQPCELFQDLNKMGGAAHKALAWPLKCCSLSLELSCTTFHGMHS